MKKIFLLPLALIILLAILPAHSDRTEATEKILLDITQLIVSKDKIASFSFSMRRDDILKIEATKEAGKKKTSVDDIDIKIISPTGRVQKYERKGQAEILLDENGDWRVDFVGPPKNLLLLKNNLTIGIKITKSSKDATPSDFMQINQLFIGSKIEEQPIFKYAVTKGDRWEMESSGNFDFKMPAIAAKSETFSGLKRNFEIGSEGEKTFAITRWGSGTVTLKRVYAKPSQSDAGATTGNTPPTSPTEDKKDAAEDPTKKLQDLMEKSKNSSDSAQIAALKDMMKLIAEMNKKDSITIPEQAFMPLNEELLVPPTNNITTSNCACKALRIEEAQFWVFWLGVGETAKTTYKETDNEFKTTMASNKRGRDLNDAYARLLIGKKNFDEKFKSNVFPRMGLDGEDVEYAVVNGDNKSKFENNQSYTPFNSMAGSGINSDYGNATAPKEDLYICLRNNNLNTPVKVFFRYEGFNTTIEER